MMELYRNERSGCFLGFAGCLKHCHVRLVDLLVPKSGGASPPLGFASLARARADFPTEEAEESEPWRVVLSTS